MTIRTKASADILDPSQPPSPAPDADRIRGRYEILLNAIDEAFCIIELVFDHAGKAIDYTFLEINATFEQQTGLQNVIGKNVRELIPNLEDQWFETYGRVASTGEPAHCEEYSGVLNRWFSVRAVRSGPAELRQVALIFSDITQRKQADRRARFLEALTRGLAGAAGEADLVRSAVGAIGALLQADRCCFLECREQGSVVVISHNWVRDHSPSVEGIHPLDDFGGIAWWHQCATGNFAVEDTQLSPLTRHQRAYENPRGFRSFAVQPYRQDKTPNVFLCVSDNIPRKWTTGDLNLMEDAIARVWPLVEKARADFALRESEDRLRHALAAANMGSWCVDLRTRMTTRDSELDRILGISGNRSFNSIEDSFRLIHLDDQTNVRAEWQKTVDSGCVYQTEFRVLRPDGDQRWLSVRGGVIRGGDGEPALVTGLALDITDKKAADEIGAVQKQLLEGLSESVLDGILIISPEGRIIHVNQRFREIWRPPPEIIDAGSDEVALQWAANQTADPKGFLDRVHAIYQTADGPIQEELCMKDGRVYERSGSPLTIGNDRRGWVWTFREITARKKVEMALRESEQRYRTLFTSMDEGFCSIEVLFDEQEQATDYRFLETNPAFQKQTGLTSVTGKRMREIAPDIEQHWINHFGIVATTGQAARFEHRAAALDRWFEVYAFRIDVPESRRVGIVFSDISERKRTEEALKKSESFLKSIIQATADCIQVMDLDGRLKWMSENGQLIFNLEDFNAHASGADFWPDGTTRDDAHAAINLALTGTAGRFRGFCPTRTGVPKWWDVIVSPIVGTNGIPVQLLAVLRDVTNVRTVEEALRTSQAALETHAQTLEARVHELRIAKREAEVAAGRVTESAERFRLLSEGLAVQVWTSTIAGALDYANQECFDYFGTNQEGDILGNGWAQYVHAEDLPNAMQLWTSSLATGHPYEVKFRLKRSEGSYRWFLVRAEAMRDSEGRPAKWFGTNTDIDELKRAQDAAERANRAKDDFLAALSHELRTPLTPVLMTASVLAADSALPHEVREQLRMIERNISLEARLIDDLLDLTKIAHGKLQLWVEPCDAHSLIGLAIEIVREDARAKTISIESSLSADPSGVLADPARFQQVVWNLLRNAVKFTPSGGKVSIRTMIETTASGSPWLRITVSDTGIGIAASRLEHIFQPFDQGGLTGDHRFGGVGLGLAIARAVVDLHGGRISATSAGPNCGSCFVVELPGLVSPKSELQAGPSTARSAETPPVSPRPVSAPPTRRLRLLLVEDHESTLMTLRRLLERDGHTVVPAQRIAEALQAAAEQPFDLVVSDVGLPDGTGTELMEALRTNYGLRGIALSGYGMEDDIARSREAGFVAHLVKPVPFAELRLALATFTSSQNDPPAG